MPSPSELSGWAGRILDSLDETTVTTGRVVTWLQNNLYQLNLAIETEFYVEDGYILPDMIATESGIYEQMYICDYFSKKANANLGANAYDWTEIDGDKQGKIRRVSKNEVAKTYRALGTDCKEQLKKLIDWAQEQDLVLAGQILYNDRGEIAQGGLICECSPPTDLVSCYSTIWVETE